MIFNRHSASVFALAGLAAAKTIDVEVGKDGLKFTPDEITAQVGDEVIFHFVKDSHDVSQGPFDRPCQPYAENGIWSGTVNVEQTTNVTFTVSIQDTDAKWLYCSVGKHCQGGMTAVINPPKSGNTLKDYTNAAEDVDKSKSPTAIYGGSLNIGNSDGDDWILPPDASESTGSHSSHSTEPTKTGTESGVETETGRETGTETASSGSTSTAQENLMISAILGLIAIGGSWFGLA